MLLELLVLLLQEQTKRGGGLVNCSASRKRAAFASLNSRKSGSLNPAKNTDKLVVVVALVV